MKTHDFATQQREQFTAAKRQISEIQIICREIATQATLSIGDQYNEKAHKKPSIIYQNEMYFRPF